MATLKRMQKGNISKMMAALMGKESCFLSSAKRLTSVYAELSNLD